MPTPPAEAETPHSRGLQTLESSPAGFGMRLKAAAANVLGDPRVLWTLVGITTVRRVIADAPVFLPDGADAYQFIESGGRALSHPGEIYSRTAAMIATGYTWTITWPPPQILLAIPFSLLPPPADVYGWVLANALMSAAGLYLLYRAIRERNRWTLPAYVLLVLLFTPLYEDIRLGQRGGPILLCAGGAMLLVRRHPVWAGALAGIGTSIKFYPAAMAISVAPRYWSRFTGALVATAGTVLALSFIPFGSPLLYATKILLPVGAGVEGSTGDCFQNSTPLLFSRLVGGHSYSMLSASGGVFTNVTLVPWHLPWLASILTYATIAGVVVATVWAARRSGWAQPYSLALAFSLGALIPGDVYTYQFLPFLPLILVLTLEAIEQRLWWTVALVGLSVEAFVNSPCALPFPGLWTIAGLVIFGAAVVASRNFAESSGRA
jgi:hypothetical protein